MMWSDSVVETESSVNAANGPTMVADEADDEEVVRSSSPGASCVLPGTRGLSGPGVESMILSLLGDVAMASVVANDGVGVAAIAVVVVVVGVAAAMVMVVVAVAAMVVAMLVMLPLTSGRRGGPQRATCKTHEPRSSSFEGLVAKGFAMEDAAAPTPPPEASKIEDALASVGTPLTASAPDPRTSSNASSRQTFGMTMGVGRTQTAIASRAVKTGGWQTFVQEPSTRSQT